MCEKSVERIRFIRTHYPDILTVTPDECIEFVRTHSDHSGADAVFEVAGGDDTFRLAWECARPNATVTIVALYDKPQLLPLPDMYGKNLTFKTGGVDGCDCAEILKLIEAGRIDTTPLITHTFPLSEIDKAYDLFEHKRGRRNQSRGRMLTLQPVWHHGQRDVTVNAATQSIHSIYLSIHNQKITRSYILVIFLCEARDAVSEFCQLFMLPNIK